MSFERFLSFLPGTLQHTIRTGMRFAEKNVYPHVPASVVALDTLRQCVSTQKPTCSYTTMIDAANHVSPGLANTTSVGNMIDETCIPRW